MLNDEFADELKAIAALKEQVKTMEEQKKNWVKYYSVYRQHILQSTMQPFRHIKSLNNANAHPGAIRTLCNLGNKRIATAAKNENMIKIWNLETNTVEKSYTAAAAGLNCLETYIDKQGKRKLVSISIAPSNTIEIWDIDSNAKVQYGSSHTDNINGALIIDQMLITGSADKTLKMKDLITGEIQPLTTLAAIINTLCLTKNNTLAIGLQAKEIQLWDHTNRKLLPSLNGHTDSINALKVLPNGNLVSASADKTLRIWDIDKAACIKILSGHQFAVNCLAISDTGYIISGDNAQSVKVWDLNQTEPCIKTITVAPANTSVVSILLLDEYPGWLLTGCSNGELRLWTLPELAFRDIETKLPAFAGAVNSNK